MLCSFPVLGRFLINKHSFEPFMWLNTAEPDKIPILVNWMWVQFHGKICFLLYMYWKVWRKCQWYQRLLAFCAVAHKRGGPWLEVYVQRNMKRWFQQRVISRKTRPKIDRQIAIGELLMPFRSVGPVNDNASLLCVPFERLHLWWDPKCFFALCPLWEIYAAYI